MPGRIEPRRASLCEGNHHLVAFLTGSTGILATSHERERPGPARRRPDRLGPAAILPMQSEASSVDYGWHPAARRCKPLSNRDSPWRGDTCTNRQHVRRKSGKARSMSGFKEPQFKDRQKAAQSARQSLLNKFRAQPGPDDPEVAKRRAEREAIAARREAVRQAREAEKAEQKRREEEAAAAEAARIAREQEEEAARLAAMEADQKAKRDARYAARKARGKRK